MKIILITVCSAVTMLAQTPTPTKRVIVQETLDSQGIRAEARTIFIGNGIGNGLGNGLQSMELISGMGVGPTVTKSPYSAEAVSESIQTLYDGNRIVQKTSAKQYRDSEGRERREEGSPMNAIFITDPVAKLSYTLHPDSKTAEKMAFGGANVTSPIGFTRAARFVTTTPPPNVTIAAPGNVAFAMATRIDTTSTAAKEEDLGTRMIEGVQAKGTRSTMTIPAGEIGNDRAIDIVDERWYSPDLQLTVLTRHADPRMGETTFKLTSIQRLEQVRSLFEIPPGYTIHEAAVFTRPLKEE